MYLSYYKYYLLNLILFAFTFLICFSIILNFMLVIHHGITVSVLVSSFMNNITDEGCSLLEDQSRLIAKAEKLIQQKQYHQAINNYNKAIQILNQILFNQ